ncbi:MAG: Cna B-type domain-containing protein [Actinomycetaceae bacterium]|nr:Cna B-type domain-containing protein [Actinomycetaceae bacterium]MDY5855225.1 Cna B-type domain-containing protein [Arcanobacterium sp.]
MRKTSRASLLAMLSVLVLIAGAVVGAVSFRAPYAYAEGGENQSETGASAQGASEAQPTNNEANHTPNHSRVVNLDLVDPNRLGSLTLLFADPESGDPLPGVHTRIYRIAYMQQNFPATAEFETILAAVGWDDFAQARATHGYASSEWDTMARTIHGYVLQEQIPPTAATTSARSGEATFADLPVGLYLVVVDGMLVDDETIRYSFTPAIVAIPSQAAGGDLDYAVVAEPKLEKMPLGKNVHYKVVKQWNDGGHRASRPHGITVDIYRDGELVQSVNLNDANNWSYEWSGVQARHEWSAVEHISDRRYTVSNQVQGTSIIITNTLPDAPPERLKETGSSLWYWWLAPLLLSGGLILIALGRGRRAASVGRGE